ncbi:MAG: CRISPR system precrRNA processing endoribonuclease RAMP protein Cas6 [Desulfurococcales archaeon]|nr:CRISPR system precrRNA processing endoribonuclease RAMP protein Cas6 [Desulfurococcales archaeon]
MLYRRIVEGGRGALVRALLRVSFKSKTVLPPFTGRVVKSFMMGARCLETPRSLYKLKSNPRPVSVSPLYRLGPPGRGAPIYATGKREVGRLVAVPGEDLYALVTYYDNSEGGHDQAGRGTLWCDEELSIGGARVHVYTESISIVDLRRLDAGRGPFRLSFESPILLPTKLMTPPFVATRRLARSARSAYRLLPTPGYVLSYAAALWASLVEGFSPLETPIHYAIGRLADVLVAELDYRVRPVTVAYGRDPKGNIRKVRGFVGFVVYDVLDPRLEPAVSKLLAFSSYMGLGKSRGAGFGFTLVESLSGRRWGLAGPLS